MEGKSRNKNQRILELYTRLSGGFVVNKAEEAVKYGVSEKSIQRDLEDINEFMADQTAFTGNGNTIVYDARRHGYHLEKVPANKLSNAELLAISKILLDSRSLTKEEMTDILNRLIENCAYEDDLKTIRELIANEKFHYIEPHHKTVFLDKMWQIGQAIREHKIIEVDYIKLKNSEIVHRELQPLAIMFSEYYFYLTAFIQGIDKEKEFTYIDDPFPTIYRLDRIKNLSVTERHFKIPYRDRFEEGEFRKRIQFMYGGRMRTVKFEYSGPSVEAVLDRLPTAEIIAESDGKYIIRAEVFGNGIEMWMKSQGDYIRVLGV